MFFDITAQSDPHEFMLDRGPSFSVIKNVKQFVELKAKFLN
jgi:hypothetical protein